MGNLRRRETIGLLRNAAILLGFAFLASGCSQAEEPVEPEVLSASAAGGVYLDAVCAVNDAWDTADLELDRLRIGLGRGEGDAAALQAALREVASASKSAAAELSSEDQIWPSAAQDPVDKVRKTLIADQTQAERVAKLSAAELAEYSWEGSETISKAAAEARAALDLPADGALACTQWREQQDGR
ncbi:hypothetical protein G7067_11145 [Leucobacter insecticola]|uniref:DUF4439 domain-containing protein n=1 Tax=Leucobacter insecticola TaxID=2714934 RepID=A0A6G8FKE9_9MICO|nr:hypothetical protein [Leucobacter insecticola]QIM16831.1 hypothetical protein G7067_11145 [Leucobacter insecticola]